MKTYAVKTVKDIVHAWQTPKTSGSIYAVIPHRQRGNSKAINSTQYYTATSLDLYLHLYLYKYKN